MVLIPGTVIMSSRALMGDYFESSVILLVKVGSDGIVGFVLNNLFQHSLNELADFSTQSKVPLYEGGPVDHNHLFFIHEHPEIGGEHLIGNVYFGGNLKAAIDLYYSGEIASNSFKIFIGYCGWDFGQLDEEIAAGDWQIMVTDAHVLFSKETDLWERLMKQYAN